MAFPEAMMHENIWFNRQKYEEAKLHYQLFLTNNLSTKHSDDIQDGGFVSTIAQVASGAGSALINEIAKARDNIKQSLAGVTTSVSGAVSSLTTDTELKNENKELRRLLEDLSKQVSDLAVRVTKLEGGCSDAKETAKKPAKDDDDDDFDLFGDDDDDDEEEETEEEKRIKEERVKKYNEKKAGKKQVIAKSSVLFDVKPWDDETDMAEMERLVRTIEMDGLIWGAAKLIPLAYGIKKLQILSTIEDDKVSTEILQEKMEEFEDFVQSVDIASFNKI